MVSDHERYGGAAIAATRLAVALEGAGHEVVRLVALPSVASRARTVTPVKRYGRAVMAVARRAPTWARVDRVLRPVAHGALKRELEALRPDAISLHNLHAAFSLGWSVELLPLADAVAPTLWTLHDMWSFTGRCAYSRKCLQYVSGCTATCPTPKEYPALSPSRIAGEWAARRDAIGRTTQSRAVAPSAWLASVADAGLWQGRVDHIPNGVPLHEYRPRDPRQCRRLLGLKGNTPVLVVAAAELADPRKGMALLVQALEQVRRPMTLLTVGAGDVAVSNPSIEVVPFGAVGSARVQALIYSAADLLLHPALADNFPLVVQEAAACGTPTVALGVGGLPELVRHGRTGWLADPDPEGLRRTLERALDEGAEQVRAACRRVAEDEWDIVRQAHRYVELWKTFPVATSVGP